MRFVIVTGMSGAGKTTALKILEDAGYFCVDNLPIHLITKFAEMAYIDSESDARVVVSVDMRSGDSITEMDAVLADLEKMNLKYEILFLDCEDSVLIKRYKETRRSHPLVGKGRVETGIEAERERLKFLRSRADYILDTTRMLTRELKQEIEKVFVENKNYGNIFITIVSFGFKYGIPNDADLVFDVRFLPNPYYVDELKDKTGMEKDVKDYVMHSGEGSLFLDKLTDMLEFLIPKYIKEGKNQLVIGIGCTGGKHRSVAVANALYKRISMEYGGKKVEHRDIENDSKKN